MIWTGHAYFTLHECTMHLNCFFFFGTQKKGNVFAAKRVLTFIGGIFNLRRLRSLHNYHPDQERMPICIARPFFPLRLYKWMWLKRACFLKGIIFSDWTYVVKLINFIMQIARRAVNTEPGMAIYNHVFVKYEYVPWKLMMKIVILGDVWTVKFFDFRIKYWPLLHVEIWLSSGWWSEIDKEIVVG